MNIGHWKIQIKREYEYKYRGMLSIKLIIGNIMLYVWQRICNTSNFNSILIIIIFKSIFNRTLPHQQDKKVVSGAMKVIF